MEENTGSIDKFLKEKRKSKRRSSLANHDAIKIISNTLLK
jgi:hypothetical protein